MPQKYNKAGQLQEYVPAGNGDASGEYGYNSGENKGGNKHFKVFKKPLDEQSTSKVNDENKINNENETSNVQEQEAKTKVDKDVIDKISNNIVIENGNEDLKKHIIDLLSNDINVEGKKLIEHSIEVLGDRIPKIYLDEEGGSFFAPYDNSIHIGKNGIDGSRNFQNKGESFIHEFTHAITENLVEYAEIERKTMWDYAPKKIKDKFKIGLAPIFDGKSLNDLIHEEAKALNRKRKFMQETLDDRDNFIDNSLKEKGYSSKELAELKVKINNSKEYTDRHNEIIHSFNNGKMNYKEAKKEFKNIFDYISENHPHLKNEVDKLQAMKKIENEARGVWIKNTGLIIVSDALSSNTFNGKVSGFGYGHDVEYYTSSKNFYGEETNNAYSNEFTSNLSSAIATGNTRAVERTKELMPKSFEAFMKIYKKYYLGEKENG